MLYFSTRNSKEKVTAAQAISHGLAPDGGLYVPETLPQLKLEDIKELGRCDYRSRACKIMKLFLDEFTEDELNSMVSKAYGDNFDSKIPHPYIFLIVIPPYSSYGMARHVHSRIWRFRCFRIC